METSKVKTFVSWSGGKDAALSYYRAMKNFHVTHFLNMVAEDGRISRSHGIRTDGGCRLFCLCGGRRTGKTL
ncbi:MAG: hypothetical protein C5S49_04015 [Candidatus Methanogaster sp.]|nr:MAG: hypothetical protein C5S49_04015 [ANME-2 cluster archaeon]